MLSRGRAHIFYKNVLLAAVKSFCRMQKYFVKIFQQWRGENMLANDRSTWVANDAELIEAIKSLSSLNIKFEEGKK